MQAIWHSGSYSRQNLDRSAMCRIFNIVNIVVNERRRMMPVECMMRSARRKRRLPIIVLVMHAWLIIQRLEAFHYFATVTFNFHHRYLGLGSLLLAVPFWSKSACFVTLSL